MVNLLVLKVGGKRKFGTLVAPWGNGSPVLRPTSLVRHYTLRAVVLVVAYKAVAVLPHVFV